jgi:4-alpha-glucanotransferase
MEENTVLYTGTHDNDTSIGWYESLNDKLSKNEIDTLKNVLKSDLKEVNWHMIEYSLQSRAMTVIVPIQDILGLGSDARMNTPGTINDKNWSWRMNGSELKNSMMEKMKNITEKANRA